MRLKWIFGVILGLLSSFSLAGQETFTPEQIRADMAFLKNRFEKMHPGMYYYTSPAVYDSVYQQLYRGVNQPMTYQEVFQYVSPLVTLVQDGHTSYKFKKRQYGKKPKLIPLYIAEFDNRYYVSYNASADTNLVRGTELLAINGEPMPQIINKLQGIYGTDNGNLSAKKYYAARAFNAFYYKYYGPADSVQLSYQLPDSTAVEHSFVRCFLREEISKTITKRYKSALRSNFGYEVLDSTNGIAKLDITSFSLKGKFLDAGQLKFKRSLKKRFAQIERDSIEHLILDFRANGGGFIPNIARTVKYFANEPFSLLDTVYFKKKAFQKVAPVYTIFPPIITRSLFRSYDEDYYFRKPKSTPAYKPVQKHRYANKVYFLMDGGSYSATTFTLALLYDMGIGTFIGQPPGGANWGSFASTWNDFKLPNSKIVVHMPLFKLTHRLPNQRSKSFVLTPDFEVDQGFGDFMNRKDSMIDFTLDLIK